MYSILLIATLALFGFIALRDRALALAILAATLPTYLLRFTIFGIPATLLEMMIVVLVCLWLVRDHGWKEIRSDRAWMIAAGLIMTSATIAVFVPQNTIAAFGIWKAYFVEPILVFFMIRHLCTTQRDRERLFVGLGFGALFVAIIGIAQWITRFGIPTPWDIERRITSVFPYPNAVGLFLGPVIVIATGMLIHARHTWRTTIFWITTLVTSLIAIVLAKSEASWVAVLASVFLLSITHKPARRYAIVVASVLLVMIATIVPIREVVTNKLLLRDYSGGVRLSQWSEAWTFLKDHPLMGAGLSGYPTAIKPYHVRKEFEIFQYPHQLFLNVWVEMGVLGLLAWTLLDLIVIKTVWLSRRLPIVLIIGFTLLEMMIHGLVDVAYFKNDLAVMTWILIALLLNTHTEPTASGRGTDRLDTLQTVTKAAPQNESA